VTDPIEAALAEMEKTVAKETCGIPSHPVLVRTTRLVAALRVAVKHIDGFYAGDPRRRDELDEILAALRGE
jgi:hypothetical protein